MRYQSLNYSSDEAMTPAIKLKGDFFVGRFWRSLRILLSAAGASLSHVDGDECLQRKERLLLRPRSKHRSNFLLYGTSAPATSRYFCQLVALAASLLCATKVFFFSLQGYRG